MKEEAKLVYLLECLQKTAPPVLVFAGMRPRLAAVSGCWRACQGSGELGGRSLW